MPPEIVTSPYFGTFRSPPVIARFTIVESVPLAEPVRVKVTATFLFLVSLAVPAALSVKLLKGIVMV